MEIPKPVLVCQLSPFSLRNGRALDSDQRKTPGDLDVLIQIMRDEGYNHSIPVSVNLDASGNLDLIEGRRRWLAAMYLGIKSISCCVYERLSDEQIILLRLAE